MNLKTRTLALEIALQATAVKPHILFIDGEDAQREAMALEKRRPLVLLIDQCRGWSMWRYGEMVSSAEDAATGQH